MFSFFIRVLNVREIVNNFVTFLLYFMHFLLRERFSENYITLR